jgi:hypothetical protein
MAFLHSTQFSDLIFGYKCRQQYSFKHKETQKTYYVDGYSPSTKVVVEYLGCYFHGHKDCQEGQKINREGISHSDAYHLTMKRIENLKQCDGISRVEVMWSCLWSGMKKTNPKVQELLDQCHLDLDEINLSIREGFRGGITDPPAVYASAHKIVESLGLPPDQLKSFYLKFLDFTSQYPSTIISHKSGPWTKPVDYVSSPVGGPVVLYGLECKKRCNRHCKRKCGRKDKHKCKENVRCHKLCRKHHSFSDWSKCPGVAHVTVLPPKSQRFPLLRITLNNNGNILLLLLLLLYYCTDCQFFYKQAKNVIMLHCVEPAVSQSHHSLDVLNAIMMTTNASSLVSIQHQSFGLQWNNKDIKS